jgi:predicted MFS family arabinose efflux permease
MVGAALGLLFSFSYGWLHGRLSITALFAVALGLVGVGLLVSGLSNELVLFTVGGALSGSGLALFSPSLSAAAIAYSGPGQSGRAVGLANGAFFCAQVIFPFVSTPLSAVVGLRGIYLVFAGLTLVIALGYGLSLLRGAGKLATPSPAA